MKQASRAYYFWINVLLIGACFASFNVFGQDKNILLNKGGDSDRFSYNKKIGANTLVGNVHFQYSGYDMYCDSAVYYKERNYVKAYGNVHINKKGKLNLFCDSLWYDGEAEKAWLWSKVRARDQEYKLTTDSLIYNSKTDEASYRRGGIVESIDGKERLTSKIGYFYPSSKRFNFKDSVRYRAEDVQMKTDTLLFAYANKKVEFFGPTDIFTDSTYIYCEAGYYFSDKQAGRLRKFAKIEKDGRFVYADTLELDGKKDLAIGRGNVCVEDSTDKLYLLGEYLYQNDSTKRMFLTRNAVAIKGQKEDSLFIHADTLFSLADSANNIKSIRANYGVRIFHPDIQGKSDSLIYNKAEGYMRMLTEPILWANKGELKGDTIDVFLSDSSIEKAHLYYGASAIFEVDSGKYYNQMAGKELFAYFDSNEMYLAEIIGNAQTIYFPEQEKKTDSTVVFERTGMNRLYAAKLKVYLDSNEVTGVTYFEQPDGKIYPINRLNKEEQFIPNFKFNPALRPKSQYDLFTEEEIEIAED